MILGDCMGMVALLHLWVLVASGGPCKHIHMYMHTHTHSQRLEWAADSGHFHHAPDSRIQPLQLPAADSWSVADRAVICAAGWSGVDQDSRARQGGSGTGSVYDLATCIYGCGVWVWSVSPSIPLRLRQSVACHCTGSAASQHLAAPSIHQHGQPSLQSSVFLDISPIRGCFDTMAVEEGLANMGSTYQLY